VNPRALGRFVVTEGIEPTNHDAGRLLRRGVLLRKNALGCRSEGGCRFVERALRAVLPLRLQGRPGFGSLHQALVTQRNGPQAPSLLPVG
jgi:hypothetical protein